MFKLLRKWSNFGYHKSEIRTAIVFGTNGENVIIVLENDEVLAYGKNQKGCLGVGVQGEVKELKRIENLCGQRIEGFECTSEFCSICIFAISGSGSVFSWGVNTFGQLGLGTTEDNYVPTKISGSLESKKVVQVACGVIHTLVLTSEGEVYAFGRNDDGQLGLGTTDDQSLPRKVGGVLDGKIVTSVACQAVSSVALLHSGTICAWGFNSMLTISAPSNEECNPCMVIGLEGVVISKIACGFFITLALSDDGKIYTWGFIVDSRSGNRIYVEKPTIISTAMMGRVKDIAATHGPRYPYAAINTNNQVYIWGSVNGQQVINPMLTSFSSLDEVFAAATPPITYQRFQLKITSNGRKRKGSEIECFQKAFDIPETSDFAFIVEGKKIHVHKAVLTFGSDVFKKKFLGNWKDSVQKEQSVEDHSYDAFYVFLNFLYTYEVDDITLDLALDVYAVADFYQVTDLMVECEKIIKSGLTVQNAAAVYEKANLIGAKNLCEFCIKFCKVRWLEVLDNFESDESKSEVILDIFRRAANQKIN